MSETSVEELPVSEEKPSSPSGRRWLKWLAGLLVLLALTIALFPFALEWGLEMALEKAGAGNVEVDDVDFNPFTGELVVKGLSTEGGQGEELGLDRAALEVDWRSLMKKRLQVRTLALQGAVIDLKQTGDGAWQVGRLVFGGPQPEAPVEPAADDQDGEPWGLGISEIALDEVLIRYADPQVKNQFRFERLHISKVFTWTPDDDTPFDVVLHLTHGQVVLKGETRPFAEHKDVRVDIDITDLELSWLAPILAKQGVSNFAGALSVQSQIKAVVRPDGLDLESKGHIELNGLKAVHPQADLARAGLVWDGASHLQLAGEGSAPDLTVRGKLTGTELDLKLSAMPLHIRQQSLECDVDVRFAGEGALSVGADLALAGLQVDDLEKKKTALELGSLNLKGVRYTGPEQIEAERLQLGDVRLLERLVEPAGNKASEFSVVLGSLIVEAAKYTGKELDIALVNLEKADLRVARDAKGELDLMGWVPKSAEGEGASSEGEKVADKPGLAVRLAKLKVGGESRLVFHDHSVSPSFEQTLLPIDIGVEKIDTTRTDNFSPVALHLGIGRYGTLDVNGKVAAFADRPTMELQGKLEGVDLPGLNAYVSDRLGYIFKQGHLGTDVTWKLDTGRLDSKISLQIDRLQLQKAGKGTGLFSKVMGMPLDSALSLLQDKDDNLHLDLPITGDLADPSFSLRSVLYQATSKAVQKATVSYFAPLGVTLLTGVVLPPGTLFVAGKMVEWAMTMKFEPVVFEPMAYEASPEASKYMDEMASLLKDRPKNKVIIYPKATRQDLVALRGAAAKDAPAGKSAGKDEKKPADGAGQAFAHITSEEEVQLARLADKRAYAVKDHLVAQGVAPGRLLICVPQVQPDNEEVPTVEVGI